MPTFSGANDGYKELPDDMPLVCEIVDVEEKDGKDFDGNPQKQLLVKFEVAEGEFQGEKFRTWVNAETFHPKSNTRKLCYAAFGIEDLKREDAQINTDDLLGKKLVVLGDYGENGEASFFKPRKFKVAKATRPGKTEKPAASSTSNGNGKRTAAPTVQEAASSEEVAAAKTASANADLDF